MARNSDLANIRKWNAHIDKMMKMSDLSHRLRPDPLTIGKMAARDRNMNGPPGMRFQPHVRLDPSQVSFLTGKQKSPSVYGRIDTPLVGSYVPKWSHWLP